MYRIKNILQKLTALVLLPVLCSQPALQVSAASNGYSYLLMPTQITKINIIWQTSAQYAEVFS